MSLLVQLHPPETQAPRLHGSRDNVLVVVWLEVACSPVDVLAEFLFNQADMLISRKPVPLGPHYFTGPEHKWICP